MCFWEQDICGSMITAVFRNSEFATTLFQVLRCIPIYLAAIPIPPETHILFYIPFLFLVYTMVAFPSERRAINRGEPSERLTCEMNRLIMDFAYLELHN
jgi:hypothetical protein